MPQGGGIRGHGIDEGEEDGGSRAAGDGQTLWKSNHNWPGGSPLHLHHTRLQHRRPPVRTLLYKTCQNTHTRYPYFWDITNYKTSSQAFICELNRTWIKSILSLVCQRHEIFVFFNRQNAKNHLVWLCGHLLHTSHLLLLGKFEYGGGPIFKVVLEC